MMFACIIVATSVSGFLCESTYWSDFHCIVTYSLQCCTYKASRCCVFSIFILAALNIDIVDENPEGVLPR